MSSFWNAHQRRITICLFAALTFGLIELAVRRNQPVLRDYDVALYQRAQEGLRSADQPDIVLMGSSRVFYGLDPDVFEQILGHRAYNVALSGSKIVEWTVLARRIFENYTPRLVVIGINASEVRTDYEPTEAARQLFCFDDLMESTRIDGFSLDVVGAYMHRVVGPWCRTYDSRYEILSWGQERLASILPKQGQLARELRERATAPRTPNGYNHPWRHGRRLKNLLQRVMEDHLAVTEEYAPKHRAGAPSFTRLKNLLAWFQDRNIRVVVAYMPNSPRTEDRWSKVEPDITVCIAQTCSSQGVPFLYWGPAELPRTNQDFLDETHVGWPLACEISLRIADYIRAYALLDDVQADSPAQFAATDVDP